jgi:hypothetical protein
MEELSGEIGIVVSGVGKMKKIGSVGGKTKDNITNV